jgi:predicted Fe-Mo cluster-binding NifX family protein
MKILIPSDDCLTIAPDFENAKAFRLLTIINGLIKEDSFITASNDLRDKYPFGLKELKDNFLPEWNNPDTSNQKNKDKLNLQIVITSGISREAEKNLQKINYEVFHTDEKNIFNALISYIKNHAAMESDYCCCP